MVLFLGNTDDLSSTDFVVRSKMVVGPAVNITVGQQNSFKSETLLCRLPYALLALFLVSDRDTCLAHQDAKRNHPPGGQIWHPQAVAGFARTVSSHATSHNPPSMEAYDGGLVTLHSDKSALRLLSACATSTSELV